MTARILSLGILLSAFSPAARLGAVPSDGDAGTPSGDWLAQASEEVRKREYHLSPAAAGGGFTAPNRAHGLRPAWHAGRLELQPRQEGGSWSFSYELLSVSRAGEPAPRISLPLAEEAIRGRLEWARDGVREWYVNDERGIEQGFVIERRPPGPEGQPVVVDGAFEGLLAHPDGDGASLLLRTPEGRDALRIGKLRVTDAAGRELPACFSVGQAALGILVDDADAVYPVTVDPLMTSPTWEVESDQWFSGFGRSVATAGDVNGDGYSDVVVGASWYDGGQAGEGRVFAYYGSASGLPSTADWTAESNQGSARFGWSVATAGDVNGDGYSDVIVGALFFDNGEIDEGRAYLYQGSASGLPAAADWTAESNQADAWFGSSVAGAGDVNGDGWADVVVGADNLSSGEASEGGAYVYHGSASGLSAAPDWMGESNQAFASFGGTVATAGDVDGDGYADLIVGARRYDAGQTDEGRAFVYHGSAGGLSPAPDWTAESDQAGADFGWGVATAGDVNGDGYSDVVVGAPHYDHGNYIDAGRAFVYHGSLEGLAGSPAWSAGPDQPNAWFGTSVATAGDVNGDGFAEVLVGAWAYDDGEVDEGRAYVYHGHPGGLSASPDWTDESDAVNGYLGHSVASAGDVNGDGYSDVIVGAGSNLARVYHGAAAGLDTSNLWADQSDQSGARMGFSVASAGDVNADGYSDLVVGAYLYDGGQLNEGAAFVYLGSASGPSLAPAWSAQGNQASAYFGTSVGGAGDVNGDGYADVIVGARLFDNVESNEGRAFVYHGSAGGLPGSADWTAESNQASAQLGSSVAGAGDVNGDGYADVVVGAPNFKNGESLEGRAYVYHGSGSGLAIAASRVLESNQIQAFFGTSVGSAGDVNRDGYSDVIIGAPDYDQGQADEGVAFVYHGAAGGIGPSWARRLEGNQAGARFGSSVASAGDVNGDRYSDVVVGAPLYDYLSLADSGRAFVHLGSASGVSAGFWGLQVDQAGARFGTSVAGAGDVNGDGHGDVIVGAPLYDASASDEGRAFVYHGSVSGLGKSWTADTGQAFADFGVSVAGAGDVNGDGYSDVVVGSDLVDLGESNEGAVFLWFGNDGDGLDRRRRMHRASGEPARAFASIPAAEGVLVRLDARSPFGRGEVRLEVERKALGVPFDGAGLETTAYIDTGAPGAAGSVVTLEELLSIPASGNHRWRARLRTLAPFPWQSHWMSIPDNGATEIDFRAP